MKHKVSPTPNTQEAQAITTALDLLWPDPQIVQPLMVQTSWRFSGRQWSNTPTTRRRP